MSLILDALNRSDREQDNPGGIPDLHTVHGQVSVAPGVPKSQVMIWLALAVVFTLLLSTIVFLVVTRNEGSPQRDSVEREAITPASLDKASSAKSLPVPTQTNATETEPKPNQDTGGDQNETGRQGSVRNQNAVSKEVRELYQTQTDAEPATIVEPEVQPAPTVIQPESAVRQSSVDEDLARQLWDETRRQMPPRRVKSNRQAEPEPEPLVEDVTDAPLDETLAGYDDVLFLHELPTNFQNSIPTLMYALHQYDARTVTINKKVYGEGEEAASGVRIERILADGILMSFKDREFKLSALSSWVNY